MLVRSYIYSTDKQGVMKVLSVGSKSSYSQSESRSYIITFIAHFSLVDSKYHNIMCPFGAVNWPWSHILSPTKIKVRLFCDLPAEKRGFL